MLSLQKGLSFGAYLSIVNDILLDSGLRSSPIKLQNASRNII